MPRPTRIDRAVVLEMRKERKTWASIGAVFGVSAGAVRSVMAEPSRSNHWAEPNPEPRADLLPPTEDRRTPFQRAMGDPIPGDMRRMKV